tara:strand:+ start:280 stop:1122 length:843 start_codon:yes stop_codon:yes gene_type:complete
MNTLKLINEGSYKLKQSNIISHQLDSEILLSKVLNKTRENLLINLEQNIDRKNVNKFEKLIRRRSLNEPIAYILKKKEFWSRNFEINNNTLIPRPETELMVEKLVYIYKQKKINILDIGTGSGCILISLLSELKQSNCIGIDISKKALKIAIKNSKKNNQKNNIKFLNRSLINFYHKKFDLIVSNPPYIRTRDIKNLDRSIKYYEPKIALDGGNDGLDVIKKVIYKSKEILKVNGLLALEIGNGQLRKVSTLLLKNLYRIEHNIRDYKNNTRCLIAKYIR